ncbi:tankyrase-1-like isoform X1 [Tachysurus ichikawai]
MQNPSRANGKTEEDTQGEYKKDELLEAARSGNEEKLMALLTPLNVNCHASDGRKVTSVKCNCSSRAHDGRLLNMQLYSPKPLLVTLDS